MRQKNSDVFFGELQIFQTPVLTNTHQYSPVLTSTRQYSPRGAPPLTGCATPYGVRLPDDDCSGLTQVGHQRWNPWRGAAPLTGCGGHPPLTGCATPGTAPRCCAAPRYCTQVDGVRHPRYCTQVLHPGTAPRYPCTQVLHPGVHPGTPAPRCCTQVLHPWVQQRSSGVPPGPTTGASRRENAFSQVGPEK